MTGINQKKCPYCKTKTEPNQKFCTNCGAKLNIQNNNKQIIILLSFVALFIISLLGINVYNHNHTQPTEIENQYYTETPQETTYTPQETTSTPENNTSKEYQHKQEIIRKFNALKYNKYEFLRLLDEADEYFNKHRYDKDENGYYIYDGNHPDMHCRREYLQKHSPELYKVFCVIEDYCWTVLPDTCMADIDYKIREEIKKH